MKPSRKPDSIRGQISLMISMMMMTFLLLFAFVVNTGMLVNAKINLQNAADLAAYAGASVQARQLTYISYLNYEMRRQWKKFLFRIYVVGNMSLDGFPRTGGDDSAMAYIRNLSNPSLDYNVPVTCIVYSQNSNECRMLTNPKIDIPPPSLDSITQTLRGQLQAIEKIRQDNCATLGFTNKMLNIYWLFNSDPDLQVLTTTDPTMSRTLNAIRTMAGGLGIVPREMILKFRVRGLEKMVNYPPQVGITPIRANELDATQDWATERTLAAFRSAYYTLGNHTFASDGITLDELQPRNVLALKEIKTQFDTFAIDFIPTGEGEAKDCNPYIIPISIKKDLTAGFSKDPTIMTYYAVRVKAKAQLLFWPLSQNPELSAYAAAQPFGSRIGPDNAEFAGAGFTPSGPMRGQIGDLAQSVPNLPLKAGDSTSRGSGWDTKSALYQFFSQFNVTTADSIIGSNALKDAYLAAMSPNPWESKNYNIMNDEGTGGGDPFVKNFTAGIASFWAPIEVTSAEDLKAEVQSIFKEVFIAGDQDNTVRRAIQDTLESNLKTYINEKLANNQGEDGEGLKMARLQNPFKSSTNSPLFLNPAEPLLFRTSWNDVNDPSYKQIGRVGYSVKIVSFDSLQTHRNKTNKNQTWVNAIEPPDEDATNDLPSLKH